MCVRGPHGLGKCKTSNALVRLANGQLVKAKELIGKSFDVLAVNETGPTRPVITKALATDNGLKPVVCITTDKGRQIECTLNHPLWADNKPYKYVSQIGKDRLLPHGSWVPAGSLEVGAIVAVYADDVDDLKPPPPPDEHIKLCAYLIGDGGLTNGVRFSQQDGPILDEFRACVTALGDSLRHYDNYNNKSNYSIAGGNIRTLLNRWNLLGKNSYEKSFPDWVWQLPKAKLALFLSRLYACDGWLTVRPNTGPKKTGTFIEVGYCSVSERLARDVHSALLRLGIESTLSKGPTTWAHNGEKKHGEVYRVQIHDHENAFLFADRVGVFGKNEEALARFTNYKPIKPQNGTEPNKYQKWKGETSQDRTQKWRRHNLPGGFVWERVTKIERLPAQPTVAITVPHYETYLTDFVEHNTALMSWAILWFATTRDADEMGDWKIPTTASVWRQLTKYLWPEIHKWARRINWSKVGRTPLNARKELMSLSLKLRTGEAFAAASDTPELIEGAHADYLLYIFDEAKVIPSKTFDAAEGAFSSAVSEGTEAFALCCSTPGPPAGRFWEIQTGQPGTEDWWVRHVTLDECIAAGRVDPVWAENRKRQWGEDSPIYINRVLGNFATIEEDVIIPSHWVEAAQDRWAAWKESGDPLPPISSIGVDVASSGENQTVIVPRHVWLVPGLSRYDHRDTMETAGLVKVALTKFKEAAIAVIDVVGVGAGVYDRLREQGMDVEPFNGAEKTDGTDSSGELFFLNKRAEAWWNMRELLDPSSNRGIALPPDDQVLSDLSSVKWKTTSAGKIQVEVKSEVKKRLGRSPDVGDAIVLAFSTETTSVASGVSEEEIQAYLAKARKEGTEPEEGEPEPSDDDLIGEKFGRFFGLHRFGLFGGKSRWELSLSSETAPEPETRRGLLKRSQRRTTPTQT